jgi:hypothetical protein
VKLHFYHRLAKVVVNLTTDNESISILDEVNVTMKGLKTEANYDLLNERLIVDNNLPMRMSLSRSPTRRPKGSSFPSRG